MINLTTEQKEFIIKNLPDGNNLILSDDVNEVLDALTDWMAQYAFDEDDEITDEGRKIERMYDDIYNNG